MHALTILQPYATAICTAGKRWENRTWAPPRALVGATTPRIAIHAGVRWGAEDRARADELDAWLADATICHRCNLLQARLVDDPAGWALTLQGAPCAFGVPGHKCEARPLPRLARPEVHTLGAVVAVARIVGVAELHGDGTVTYAGDAPSWGTRPLGEIPQNRWFLGPAGWALDDVEVLARPVPVRGLQGLWRLPEDAEAAVCAQLVARGPGRAPL